MHKTNKKTEYRVHVANQVIDTFWPKDSRSVELRQRRELLIAWHPFHHPDPLLFIEKPARLRKQGDWLLFADRAPWGGTCNMAIAQLIRYVRGLPRQPLSVWRHWNGKQIMLGNQQTLPILIASDYGVDDKTNCVLCGQQPNGIDWWSLDGVTGPCCTFGECREKRRPVSEPASFPVQPQIERNQAIE